MCCRVEDINFEDLQQSKKEKYDKWTAYCQSKYANCLFANEFDRRYKGKGVRAFPLHPGVIIQTDLIRGNFFGLD